jgi:hypothetical protein
MEVHRKAASAGDAESIRLQAALLAEARHPGVIDLVGVEGSADRPVLVTALVDGPTLAVPMELSVEEIGGVVAGLASTLADLHDLGIVHGAVAPEHVLLGPDGRPVLCGFGSAARVGETGPAGDQERHPSEDVAALGRLLRRLSTGPEARALRRIADSATADDPAARPSARAMSAEIAAAVPGARLPGRPTGAVDGAPTLPDLRSLLSGARADRRRPGGRRARPAPSDEAESPAPGARASLRQLPVRSGAMVGAVGAVAGAALLVLAPWASPAAKDRDPIIVPVTVPTTPSSVVPTSRAPVTSASVAPTSMLQAVPAGCPAPTSVLVADIDGDGCLDALRYADGVLEAAGLRWSLGQAGDQLATGDWSCRGTRTVVLLRPSTGQVFRFESWAVGVNDSITGSAVATVPGGQAVRAADVDRDGCHELVVERGELPPQVVRLPRTPT